MTEAVSNLKNIGAQMLTHKAKSPVIAGLMSAIIPGSGKFYSGKKGGAISSFISTTGFGVVTYENYKKRGMNNLNTLLFGSAFLVSYFSGIYGSIISVSTVNTEYNENLSNTILFNIHIPLRTVFNK